MALGVLPSLKQVYIDEFVQLNRKVDDCLKFGHFVCPKSADKKLYKSNEISSGSRQQFIGIMFEVNNRKLLKPSRTQSIFFFDDELSESHTLAHIDPHTLLTQNPRHSGEMGGGVRRCRFFPDCALSVELFMVYSLTPVFLPSLNLFVSRKQRAKFLRCTDLCCRGGERHVNIST